ncbi:MAG: hypothetical protein JOY78_17915 [Pseudonocardia sp.]|nr:hypothetical protein [Pseudonocardia sp.]
MVHVTTIDPADPAVVEDLAAFSAATIHEAQGRKGAVNPSICLTEVLRAKGLTADLP